MPSLSDILHSTAARTPDRDALIFEGRTTTYRDFEGQVERFASVLADRGVKHGDRVMLFCGNSDTFVVAAYGILRTGAIFVPANPRSAPPELAYLLADSGASAFIIAPELAENVRAVAEESGATLFSLGDADGFENILELAATTTLPPVSAWPAESDDSMIIYTSGTTGHPKGALFDHHRSIWVGVNVTALMGMHEAGRMLHVAPMYHAAELCIMVFPGMMTSTTHVILPAFDPAVVAQTMAEQKITSFFGVPTMYQYLLQVPGLDELDLSSWTTGMFGAAPMPASVVKKLIEKLPAVDLYQLCGQTEAGPGGSYSGPADVIARPDASARYAIPNTEIRVVAADGTDVAPGEVGEMILRGETMMKGYWNKPEETARTLIDGWVHTGDLALVDEDGYMTLVDRLKDMIITGGRNVYSVEVENALMAHPDIVDVAILGVPHETYGESILAVIVPREGTLPTIDEVRAWVRDQISDYKIPHYVVVHSIPRNPSGKIQKHILRAELESEKVS